MIQYLYFYLQSKTSSHLNLITRHPFGDQLFPVIKHTNRKRDEELI